MTPWTVACIYIYTHTYIHTHTHTYIYPFFIEENELLNCNTFFYTSTVKFSTLKGVVSTLTCLSQVYLEICFIEIVRMQEWFWRTQICNSRMQNAMGYQLKSKVYSNLNIFVFSSVQFSRSVVSDSATPWTVACIYIYTHTYIHTHTHIHIPFFYRRKWTFEL